MGSSIYMMDFPASVTCAVAMGVNTPWLIALFKNSTFAGSIKMATKGSSPRTTRKFTPTDKTVRMPLITGPISTYPSIAKIMPIIPAEKLLISISKPAGICPSIASSNFSSGRALKFS